MTIERNGQVIELSATEVRMAHEEYEKQCYAEDLVSRASDNGIELPDEKAKELAEKFDRALSKNDSYFESYWLTADYVLEEAGYKA